MFFTAIISNGLWLLSAVKLLPSRYVLKCWQAKTIAKSSLSILAYLVSVSMRLLLAKATGWSSPHHSTCFTRYPNSNICYYFRPVIWISVSVQLWANLLLIAKQENLLYEPSSLSPNRTEFTNTLPFSPPDVALPASDGTKFCCLNATSYVFCLCCGCCFLGVFFLKVGETMTLIWPKCHHTGYSIPKLNTGQTLTNPCEDALGYSRPPYLHF